MDNDTRPLLEDKDEVSIDIYGNSPAPPLPPGKLYHVFFSYAESDTEFVASLIQRLEKLGYKCCDHKRDFVPGWKILDNIQHCVMSSVKTVVIISKESVESSWCSYEAELTLHMSMDMRKKILIPILVDNCTLPDHLRPLTYIDARGDSSATGWWQKLVDATSQPDEVPLFENNLPNLSSQPYAFNPNFSNLDHLVTLESKSRNCMKEEITTKLIPNELCSRGIQVPYPVFKEEMNNLNKELIFGFHCCCYCRLCWIPWIVVLSCLIITATIILYIMSYSCKHLDPGGSTGYDCNGVIGNAVVWTIILLSLPTTFIILTLLRNRKERQLLEFMSNINRRLTQYQIMMTFKSKRFSRGFTISVVYYNYQPCLDYITSKMTKIATDSLENIREENSITEDNIDTTMTHLTSCSKENTGEEDAVAITEEATKEILTRQSCLYLRQYLDGKLSYPSEPRHTRNTVCLCQFVEETEKLEG